MCHICSASVVDIAFAHGFDRWPRFAATVMPCGGVDKFILQTFSTEVILRECFRQV